MPTGQLPEAQFRRNMHDYFRAMGIPIIRGRGFTADDGPTAPSVAVVNRDIGAAVVPRRDPIGKRVHTGTTTGPWTTIVGVIGDVRHSGLEKAPEPRLYIHSLQNPPVNPFIVIRAAGDPALLMEIGARGGACDRQGTPRL